MKSASPLEIAYTLAFALVLALAARRAIRKVRSVMRVARYKRRLKDPRTVSAESAIAWGTAERAFMLTGVVLALLIIGAVALFLPPNPANPNNLIPGIAFLVAAVLIAAVIVREDQWDGIIEGEVRRHWSGHTNGEGEQT